MPNIRKHDNIHILQGTHQPCRHGKPENKPQIPASMPDAPEFLEAIAKKEFERVASMLFGVGVMTEADRTILTQYAVLWGQLAKDPDNFGAPKHSQLRLIQGDLGMTPASRCKIKVTAGDEKKTDPWEGV